MTKPFLILQARPEDEAAEHEFDAILQKGGLTAERTQRFRLEQESLPADLALDSFAGVIVGGGPGCVSDPAEGKAPQEARAEATLMALLPQVIALDMPFMGCCLGMGMLAAALGGRVSKDRYGEPVGAVEGEITGDGAIDPILKGLPNRFPVLVGHKEAVQELPPNAVHLMSSAPCPFQMIRAGQNVYATQFHPEADGDVFAKRIEIYRHHGYFPPQDAQALTDAVQEVNVDIAPKILANFVSRFS